VRSELSGPELRRACLRAMGDVVRALDVRAAHVIFGHTHRAGPLPGDELHEWGGGGAPRLMNAGCWVDEPLFSVGGPGNPYWAGRGVVVPAVGPPVLERIVEDLATPPGSG